MMTKIKLARKKITDTNKMYALGDKIMPKINKSKTIKENDKKNLIEYIQSWNFEFVPLLLLRKKVTEKPIFSPLLFDSKPFNVAAAMVERFEYYMLENMECLKYFVKHNKEAEYDEMLKEMATKINKNHREMEKVLHHCCAKKIFNMLNNHPMYTNNETKVNWSDTYSPFENSEKAARDLYPNIQETDYILDQEEKILCERIDPAALEIYKLMSGMNETQNGKDDCLNK